MTDYFVTPLTTNLKWNDFKANDKTLEHLDKLKTSFRNFQDTTDQISNVPSSGHLALFQGPAGSGKSLAAALTGIELNKPVYEINLSEVVSKYMEETEKNLDSIFNAAQETGSILLFDEADALFGERTSVTDSHDRYSNLEIAYFLQRLQNYNGLAIIATRTEQNVGEVFTGGFHTVVHFPPYV